MFTIDEMIAILDAMLNTKRKRHIAGGVLLSLSLLFGGLSTTIITIKDDDPETTEYPDYTYYSQN